MASVEHCLCCRVDRWKLARVTLFQPKPGWLAEKEHVIGFRDHTITNYNLSPIFLYILAFAPKVAPTSSCEHPGLYIYPFILLLVRTLNDPAEIFLPEIVALITTHAA